MGLAEGKTEGKLLHFSVYYNNLSATLNKSLRAFKEAAFVFLCSFKTCDCSNVEYEIDS